MAVPKKRKSKARKRTRRAQHDKATPPTLTWCSNCGSPKEPHRVCMACGYYRGRAVLPVFSAE